MTHEVVNAGVSLHDQTLSILFHVGLARPGGRTDGKAMMSEVQIGRHPLNIYDVA